MNKPRAGGVQLIDTVSRFDPTPVSEVVMRREKKRFVAQDGHGKRYTLVLFSEVGPGGKVRERIETETGKRVWRVEKGVYEMGYTAKKLHSTDPDAP